MHGDVSQTVSSLVKVPKSLIFDSLSLNWVALISSVAGPPQPLLCGRKLKNLPLTLLAFNSLERLLHPASPESVDQNKFSPLNRVTSGSSGKCNLLWNLSLHLRLEAKCSALLHLSTGPCHRTGWMEGILARITQETLPAVVVTDEVGLKFVNYPGYPTLLSWQGQAMICQSGNKRCLMAAILLSVRGQVSCARGPVFIYCSDNFANWERNKRQSQWPREVTRPSSNKRTNKSTSVHIAS